jgi:outer membrane protein OmpA-like peptidoglycan-associated protein
MLYLLFGLTFLACFPNALAQNTDFSGTWTGILHQEEGGVGGRLSEFYEFSITIKQDKNGNLTGTSTIHINAARDYGVISLIGKANAQGVSIDEQKIIEQNIREEAQWCIKIYTLKYNSVTESLSGAWKAKNICSPGTIELTRPKKVASVKKPHEKPDKKEVEKAIKEIDKPTLATDVPTLITKIADLPANYLSIEDIKIEIKSKHSIMGKKVILDNVYFGQSSSNLLVSSYKALTEVANFLKENPSLKVKINGHTDNVGQEHNNKHLSKLRAIVVMNYLINKGIDEKRISSDGFGSTLPIRPNDTENNKKQNRRVEFEIL